ncbi:GPN-loop GTPase 2-like [Zophobas morio]|uniref:GPN-loop GTPase 2-like n=1 Tax=Zophobas morio TaxID=2755281 RepID=UPI0030835003
MSFGQVVIGPPGSGKTTYCRGMKDFLTALGREVVIVNLDPANFFLPYECAVNISSLISLKEVMTELQLGPNGAMIYCMEYLELHSDWLFKELNNFKEKYILFDCPGQIELYTHHHSVKNIFQLLLKWNFRLCAVHLVDSHYCTDPSKFISVLLTSLSAMLQVELPHVNVLSKIDLIEKYDELDFNLDYYTEVMDLKYLLSCLSNDFFFSRFESLNTKICEIIENFGLVNFIPLMIEDKETMLCVLRSVDKANGYVFGALENNNMAIFKVAASEYLDVLRDLEIQEKYLEDIL